MDIAIAYLIKPSEAYATALPDGSCTAYPDPASSGDPWTIGFGSTGPDIKPGTIWSRDMAETRLRKKVVYFTNRVLKMSPILAKDGYEYKLAAIISFAYNLGDGNYFASTLKRRVNEENWEAAAVECRKWNKARGKILRGLTIRRNLESQCLLK